MTKVAFDTSAAIKLMNGQYDLVSLGIDVDSTDFSASYIVRMELLSKRIMKEGEEFEIKEFLDRVNIIPMDEEIEEQAIVLRRSTKLKLPDSIVAATAIVLDAVLLTDDDDLLKLSWQRFRARRIM